MMRLHDPRIAGEVAALVADGAPELRDLLMYQPPFDGSTVTQAYLSVLFQQRLLRPWPCPDPGCPAAAYGQAAADTLAHMDTFGVPYRAPPPYASMNRTAREAAFAALVPPAMAVSPGAMQILRIAQVLSITLAMPDTPTFQQQQPQQPAN